MFTNLKFTSNNRPGEYLDYIEYRSKHSDDKLPLVIYIHGAGSRGSDINALARTAVLDDVEKGKLQSKNVMVVAPQCHCDTWFELYDVLLEFVNFVRHDSDVDIHRVYVTGASMGGYTTWQLIMTKPNWFAAAVPICGGGMCWNSGRIANMPVWAFHGALDPVVLPSETLNMVRAINQSGGNAKITILPNVTHNVWEFAFDEKTYEWMFSQRLENPEK